MEQEQRSEVLRFCRVCGVVLEGRRRVMCAECAAFERRRALRRDMQARFCLICGVDLSNPRARYCEQCRRLYTTAAARRLQEQGVVPTQLELEQDAWLQAARRRAQRRCRISGDRIAQLAQLYGRPYNSYGKLRAFIEEFDRLPDERFLKRNQPASVDWQARPEDRAPAVPMKNEE